MSTRCRVMRWSNRSIGPWKTSSRISYVTSHPRIVDKLTYLQHPRRRLSVAGGPGPAASFLPSRAAPGGGDANRGEDVPQRVLADRGRALGPLGQQPGGFGRVPHQLLEAQTYRGELLDQGVGQGLLERGVSAR